MPTDTISLDFLARQQEQILEELRGVRAENRDIRRTFTLISEHFSRQERRLGELRDDLETMIKLELGGAIANLETRLEQRSDSSLLPIEARLGAVESRLDGLDTQLKAIDARVNETHQKLDAILAAVSR
jgi:predicted negative regulator of RcsB-dependent stress response